MLSKCSVFAALPYEGLKTAKGFYEGQLGLKVQGGSVAEGWLEFEAAGGTTIQVFESDSPKSDDTAATFEVDDLADEMDSLRRKGVKFEEHDLPEIKTQNGVATMGPDKAAWFKDPSGNVIALHQTGE